MEMEKEILLLARPAPTIFFLIFPPHHLAHIPTTFTPCRLSSRTLHGHASRRLPTYMRRRRSPLAALWLAAAWALQLLAGAGAANPTWCIVRTGAPVRTVQAALDYACSPAGGADCAPIQPSALCYLPNTLAAHASYAFNSIYQRSHAAPGACDFAGTATVTLTDPSYGSCTFPASPGAAGSPGSATSTSRPPPGNRKPDLGSDDDDSDADQAHVATANAPFMSLALSCFVYLHLRWW